MAVFSNLGEINLGEWNLGDNTVAGGPQELAGVSGGTSTVVGALTVGFDLAGIVLGTSLCQGTLAVARSLAGSSAGVATVSGTLTILTTLHFYGSAPGGGREACLRDAGRGDGLGEPGVRRDVRRDAEDLPMSATNPTFGEIRFQCQKRWPGLDEDVLDSFINERYRRVLRRMPWQRARVQAVLQTVAPYTTGTVAVTEGSADLALTDGTWTAGMSGRAIRIGGDNPYYQFTFATAATGTLDRVYEGTTDAAATYSVWQNIYVLPSDLRLLHSMRVFDSPQDLDPITQEQLDERAPTRSFYGTPNVYATHMDDLSTPPRRQVELYPIPDAVLAVPFWYTQDPTLFSASSTASFFAPWLIPDTIYAGVEADALGKEKDYAGADRAELRFAQALTDMLMEEARRIGPRRLKMADRYTRHNRRRWSEVGYAKDP